MTAFHAARVAVEIRKRLGLEVEKQHGGYGTFEVRLDGEPVVDGGALAFLGLLPDVDEVVEKLRARLSA